MSAPQENAMSTGITTGSTEASSNSANAETASGSASATPDLSISGTPTSLPISDPILPNCGREPSSG